MSIVITFKDYYKYLIIKAKRSDRYKNEYFNYFSKISSFFEKKDLCLENVDEYIYTLIESGLQPSSINNYIKHIKNIVKASNLDFADEIEYREAIQKDFDILTKEEIEKIIDCKSKKKNTRYGKARDINFRYYVIFSVLAVTGMRISELINIKHEDISTEYISIRQSKNKKGRKAAILPHTYELIKKLPKYDHNYVFGTKKGKLIHQKVNKELKIRSKLSGINKRVTTHTFRRTIATLGKNPFASAKQLGHSRIETTYRYYQENMQQKKELVEGLPISEDHIRYQAVVENILSQVDKYRKNKYINLSISTNSNSLLIKINKI